MFEKEKSDILKNVSKYNKVIIYGIGVWGKRIFTWLEEAGLSNRIVAVVDNDEGEKLGELLGSFRICKLVDVHVRYDAIIIASIVNKVAIQERLDRYFASFTTKPIYIFICSKTAEKKFSAEEYETYLRYLQSRYSKKKTDFVGITKDDYLYQDGDPRIIAWYLPQYYTFELNNRFHGTGFTEWTNTAQAIPLFCGHEQPHIPYDLGFYRLENIATLYRQAELARKYGIYGFCFHYYWFSGYRIMEQPLKMLLENKDINIHYCINWAMENWTVNWDGGKYDLMCKQNYTHNDVEKFMNDILPFFCDERYIKIDGKPVIMFYRISAIGKENFIDMLARMREFSKRNGFPDIYVMVCDCDNFDYDVTCLGADALVQYAPAKLCQNTKELYIEGYIDPRFRGSIRDAQEMIKSKRYLNEVASKEYYRSALVGFDNTARRLQFTSFILHNMTAELYKDWLKNIIIESRSIHTSEKNYVFVASWNEWAEGSHLEPDVFHGYAYLQATKEALEECREL